MFMPRINQPQGLTTCQYGISIDGVEWDKNFLYFIFLLNRPLCALPDAYRSTSQLPIVQYEHAAITRIETQDTNPLEYGSHEIILRSGKIQIHGHLATVSSSSGSLTAITSTLLHKIVPEYHGLHSTVLRPLGMTHKNQ